MRKYSLYAACLCASLVLGVSGCSAQASAQTQEASQSSEQAETTAAETEVVEAGQIESMEETAPQAPQPSKVFGPVTWLDDESFSLDNQSGQSYSGEMTVNLSDETLILDAVSGMPYAKEDIKDGDIVYAYIGPAMTMSLPPMTNAQVVLCGIPADAKAPDYVEIKSVVTDASETASVLTSADGVEYSVPTDCQIFPYLTRNIVTLNDLTEGRTCLIWSDDANTAEKIMVFAQ